MVIELPKIVLKDKAIEEMPNIIKDLGVNSIFCVFGKTTYDLVGNRILDVLKDYKLEKVYVDACDELTINKVTKKGQELKTNLIIGIGGGKNIDLAKAVSYQLNIPCISVPTIPSHDGIASNRSVVSKEESKYPVVGKLPIAIIADLEILSKAPARFFAAGCGDVIAKKTAVLDWKLARDERGEEYDDFFANLAYLTADLIIKNANVYEKNYKSSVELLMNCLITCGLLMAISKSSRPCSGSEHMFCHTIDKLNPKNKALHGEKVALGTYIMSYLHGINYEEIRDVLISYKLPITHEEINIPPEVLVEALFQTHEIRSDKRYTILRDGIKKEEARRILKELKVI